MLLCLAFRKFLKITGIRSIVFVLMCIAFAQIGRAQVTQITPGNNINVSPSGGTGNVTVTAVPSGSTTQIQVNDGGTFSGSNVTTDSATKSDLHIDQGNLTAKTISGQLQAKQWQTGSGNNGIANAFASSNCAVAFGCIVAPDNNYTGEPENYPIPSSTMQALFDTRKAAFKWFSFNPVTSSQYNVQNAIDFRSVLGSYFPNNAVMRGGLLNLAFTTQGRGGSYGTTGISQQNNKATVDSLQQSTFTANREGIKNGLGLVMNCYSVGDCNSLNVYTYYDPGATAGSDEGAVSFRNYLIENTAYYHGTITAVAPGVDSGSNLNSMTDILTASYSDDPIGNHYTPGTELLDITQGNTLNKTAKVYSNSTVGGLAVLTVENSTIPQSSAWGTTTVAVTTAGYNQTFFSTDPPPTTPPTPPSTTVSLTLSGLGASPGDFVTGLACMVGTSAFLERVNITVAPMSSGGVQGITFQTTHPWPAGSRIFQGGPCGTSLVANDTWKTNWWALGSTASTNLIVAACFRGDCTGTVVLGNYPVPAGNIAFASTYGMKLQRTSNVVSLSYSSSAIASSTMYNMPVGTAIEVRGTGTDFDGTFTVTSNTLDKYAYTNAITWAQTDPDEASTSVSVGNLIIAEPTIKLYPSATVIGVPTATLAGATPPPLTQVEVGKNNVSWTFRDVIEDPHHASNSLLARREGCAPITPGNGVVLSCTQMSFTGTAVTTYGHLNSLTGPVSSLWRVDGNQAPTTFFDFKYQPKNNGSLIAVGGPADGVARPFTLLSVSNYWNSVIYPLASSNWTDQGMAGLGYVDTTGITFGYTTQLGPKADCKPYIMAGSFAIIEQFGGGVRCNTTNGHRNSFSLATTDSRQALTLQNTYYPGSAQFVIESTLGNDVSGTSSVGSILDMVNTTNTSGSRWLRIDNEQNAFSFNVIDDAGTGTIARTPLSINLTTGATSLLAGSSVGGSAICTTSSACGSLAGTSGSLGGSALAAGSCATATVTVTGASVGLPVAVSTTDGSLPDPLIMLRAAVTASNTVTVQICAIAAVTPASETYNVRVIR